MFVRNGPVYFYNKIRSIIERRDDAISATDMIEERVGTYLQASYVSIVNAFQDCPDLEQLN